MTMTKEEERDFILKELQWTLKQAEAKYGELDIATKRWRETQFRADITQKALDDFYEAHPEMRALQQCEKE